MGAGHASTSIGYAVGIKEGMRHLESAEDGKVVAVIGDGAMTGGVAFEAIGQAGGLGTPIVVVLNDNGMSIAPNVGALSRYFNRVRLNPKLWHARSGVEGGLTRLPGGIGAAFERLGPHLKESIKAFWAPGPVVGGARLGLHGRDRRPRRARAARGAARGARGGTPGGRAHRHGQGQGLRAGRGRAAWRAWRSGTRPSPSSILNGSPTRPVPVGAQGGGPRAEPPRRSTRRCSARRSLRECERDERVVGITAAMNSGTGLNILQKAMPDRYFDVGIAEQQAILFASGPRAGGRQAGGGDLLDVPAARLRPDRARRVPAEACNVVFAMDRAGLVGDDGPTHHGVFDIAYLRCLPNIVLMAPRDEAMLVHMLRTALEYDDGPVGAALPARARASGVPLPERGRADRDRNRRDPVRGASGRRRTLAGAWR